MPKATVRANARTLPEATPHSAEDVRALAAQFEAALPPSVSSSRGFPLSRGRASGGSPAT
jgi:hypothetical protein